MYSIVSTASVHGIGSMIVQVEADVCDGMPVFEMVGILSSEVREAKERIRAAIRNTGFSMSPKKVTINLCPADVKKSGSGFDLPIALAVLSGYGLIKTDRLSFTFSCPTYSERVRGRSGLSPSSSGRYSVDIMRFS